MKPIFALCFTLFVVFCGVLLQAFAQTSTTKPSYFESDSRLAPAFSVSINTHKHETLLRRLKRATQVPLSIDDAEIRVGSSFIATDKPSVRGVLEALATVYGGRWERTPQKGYKLLGAAEEVDAIFGFHTETQRARNEAGNQMLQTMQQMPPEERAKLFPPESQPGTSFADLPDTIQDNIRKMVDAINEEDMAKGDSPISEKELSTAKVHFVERQHTKGLGFRSFWFSLNGPNLNYGWRINTYQSDKKRREQVENARLQKGLPGNFYNPQDYILPEPAKTSPVFQKRVSLRMQKATVQEALQRLHEQTGVSVMCAATTKATKRFDLTLNQVTLEDALDKLVRVVAKANPQQRVEWCFTKYGFVVISQMTDFQQIKPTTATNLPKPTDNN